MTFIVARVRWLTLLILGICLSLPPFVWGQSDPPVSLMKAMILTSQAFRDASKKIEPTLVTIESFGGVSAIAGRIGGIRKQGEGNTTGVMISPDGFVVTSTFNFIERPPVITVITSDGERHLAKLLGEDRTRKICLLKIETSEPLPFAESVDPSDIQVGQWVVSVGVGFGDSNPAISSGIISAKNRVGGKAIQTDANVSPACYGGPLVDLRGRMIGICVPLNPQSQAIGAGVEWYDSGIGFAIPLFGLEAIIERLKQGKTIEPAFLGVQATANSTGVGLVINEVVKGSAAEKAGLVPTDVLLNADQEELVDPMKLKQLLNRFEAGMTIQLTVLKGGKGDPETLDVELGMPAVDPKQSQLEPPRIR